MDKSTYSNLPVSMSVNEFAKLLGVSQKLARKIVKEKNLALRVGQKRLIVPRHKVLEFLKSE